MLVAKHAAKAGIVLKKRVFLANNNGYLQLPYLGKYIIVVQVGHVHTGHVVVHVFIAVAIKQIGESGGGKGKVVAGAHANRFLKILGMF